MSTTMTKREAKALLVEIEELVESHQRGSMDLCRVVYQVSDTTVSFGGDLHYLWQLWGYDSWNDFVGLVLGIHPTTAYVYRRIHEVFYVDLAGCWDHGNLLPVTKMRILAADRSLNKRNVNAKLKRALNKTCPQLVAEIYGVDELKHLSVSVSGSEMKTIGKAIEKARKAFTEKDGKRLPRGQVLARMAREWATVHDNIERTKKGKLRLAS